MARLQIPHATTPLIDPNTGLLALPWFNFLADLSTRVAVNVPALDPAATLPQTVTAFNTLLEALVESFQMEPE